MSCTRPWTAPFSAALLLFAVQLVPAQPILVVEFDFDGPLGEADPEGWVPLFNAEQPASEIYFHVDDFSGQGSRVPALSGSKSMWCALTAEDPRTCHWGTPPGYGTNWSQLLSSMEFVVQGDVTLSFLALVDVEEIYDWVSIQYEANDASWVDLAQYSCFDSSCITPSQNFVIPSADHDGTIRFRFLFRSDGCCDDENAIYAANVDGFIVDDLLVADATGTVNFQDFEAEAVGDQTTLDGAWWGEKLDYVDGGILAAGGGVLQESTTLNSTNLWGFFDGSPLDFGCAGHPGQAVPAADLFSHIQSPLIDLTMSSDGNEIVGMPDSIVVEFDVYRDIPEAEFKRYDWNVVGFNAEPCEIDKSIVKGSGFGDDAEWFRERIAFVPTPDLARIQLELGLYNRGEPASECRSHSPLYDNVTVTRYGGVLTATDEAAGVQSLVLSPNRPNPFNPATTLHFVLPADAGHTTLRVYDVAGRLVRTIFEGPLPSGAHALRWDGRDRLGSTVASGVYVAELVADEQRATRRMVLLK